MSEDNGKIDEVAAERELMAQEYGARKRAIVEALEEVNFRMSQLGRDVTAAQSPSVDSIAARAKVFVSCCGDLCGMLSDVFRLKEYFE